MMVDTDAPYSVEHQQRVAMVLLPTHVQQFAATAYPNRVLFFEQQIHALAKLSALHCLREPIPQLGRGVTFHRLQRALFGVTDLLDASYRLRQELLQGVSDELQREERLRFVVQNHYYNARDSFELTLQRSNALYRTLAAERGAAPETVDLESAFLEAAGVTLRDYLGVVCYLVYHFDRFRLDVDNRDPAAWAFRLGGGKPQAEDIFKRVVRSYCKVRSDPVGVLWLVSSGFRAYRSGGGGRAAVRDPGRWRSVRLARGCGPVSHRPGGVRKSAGWRGRLQRIVPDRLQRWGQCSLRGGRDT